MIQTLLKEIQQKFKRDKNLLSLTLTGSFSNPNKPLEKFNDIDLVFIFKKVTKNVLEGFHALGIAMGDTYSNNNIGITYTLKIGPRKEKSDKPKTIMLHFLVYSKESYLQETTVTRFTWKQYEPLLGKPLKKFSNVTIITKEDVQNTIDGIPAMKRWIQTKSAEYVEPRGKTTRIVRIQLDTIEYLEVICYSILMLATNMLRIKKIYTDTHEAMCIAFQQQYLIQLRTFPKTILQHKKDLRRGRVFSEEKVKELKRTAIQFIKQCEEAIA